MKKQTFSYQGINYLGMNVNGKMKTPVDMGNSSLKLDMSVDTEKMTNSRDGSRGTYDEMTKSQECTGTLTLNDATVEALSMGLYAKQVVAATGTVSGESFPSDLVVGDMVRLDNPFASAIVLTDSTASPVTLEAGKHYNVISAAGGLIEIISVTGLKLPILASYSYAKRESFALFGTSAPERYLMLDGINTVDNNSPVIIDLYRVKFKPFKSLDAISEGFGKLELEFTAIADTTNQADPNLGGYGRIMRKQAV
jgi:hypothetical protein